MEQRAVFAAVELAGLQFAEADAAGGAATTEIEVCRDGQWEHPCYGEIEITPSVRARMAENFRANVRRVGELPLDYDHETGPASGWIQSLRNEGERLVAAVRFTPRAREQIRSGEYRFFSPEWSLDWKDPATGQKHGPTLFGGGITNRPFFRELSPVRCREWVSSQAGEDGGAQPQEGRDMAVTPETGATRETEAPAVQAGDPGAQQHREEVQQLAERLRAVEMENAALRAAEQRRGVTADVEALRFGERRLAPQCRAKLTEGLLALPEAGRVAVLEAIRNFQFVELGERGFTPAAAGGEALSASEEAELAALAARNGLKVDEMRKTYAEVRARRGRA